MTKQRRIIDSYLSGNYPDDVSEEFVSWFDSPVDQEIKQEELLASWDALEASADPQDIRDAFESVKRDLNMMTQGGYRFRKRGRVIWRHVAAAIVIAALTAGMTLFLDNLFRPSEQPVEWLDTYCPYGQTLSVALPDGSSIKLNAGSRLMYPTAFSGSTRKIFLSGEALADIVKDSEKIFVISTNDLNITVHGTLFNVRSYPEDSESEVILFSGSIDLNTKHQDHNRKISLTPGDMVRIDRSNGSVAIEDVPTESFSDDASLVFVNTRLIDITAQLERVFDVNFVIGNPDIAQQRYLASFINGESLDEILAVLAKTGKIKYRKSVKFKTIYID